MTKNKPKLLFISRAYPPTFGGIENQNFGIAKHLSKLIPTTVIANKRGKKFLPLFLPWAALQSLFLLPKHNVVLLGDGVLAPIGAFLSIFFPNKKFICIVHGLDITYAQKKSLMGTLYRWINIPSLKLLDRLIMVGNQTIETAVEAGIPRKKCVFIPNGAEIKDLYEEHSRSELAQLLNADISNKKIILRVGRYVEHKGVEWFIRNVLPKLPKEYVFIAAGGVVSKKTAGDQDYFPLCQKTVREHNLKDRIHLLTNLPWKYMKILFNTADIIVSPNIRIAGSMEGFGINAIEGALCKKIVIASDLDGLKDAIKHKKNGYLVEPESAQAFMDVIQKISSLDDSEKQKIEEAFQKYTLKRYSWDVIAKQYYNEIQTLVS